MKKKLNRILALLLIVIGLIYFIPFINKIFYKSDWIIGTLFIIWGLIGAITSLGKQRSALLFLSTILFLLGIELLLPLFFIIRMSGGFIAMSLLLILGFSFLILFIDNSKEKIYLSLAIGFLLFSYLVPNLPRLYWFSRFFDRLGLVIINIWPILIIILGIGFLVESNRKH